MTKMVWGCFQWIGFHLLKDWLDEGQTVIGIDSVNTEQKETLEMFVGRNANFTRYETIEECLTSDAGKRVESVIVFEDENYDPPFEKLIDIPASAHIRVNVKEQSCALNSWVTIELPHVYGPWMTNDKNSVTDESIYITDVIPTIKAMIEQNWNTDLIKVGMETDDGRNNTSIIAKVSMEEGMKLLRDHQKRFPAYY